MLLYQPYFTQVLKIWKNIKLEINYDLGEIDKLNKCYF